MTIDLPEGDLPKDVAAIIFTPCLKGKARVAATLFLDEFHRLKCMSRHAISEFVSVLAGGRFLWHNARFRYSRKGFYSVILRRLMRLGCVYYGRNYAKRRLIEGYWVDPNGFPRLLRRVQMGWEELFRSRSR